MTSMQRDTIYRSVLEIFEEDRSAALDNIVSTQKNMGTTKVPSLLKDIDIFQEEIARINYHEERFKSAYKSKDGVLVNKLIREYVPGLIRPSGDLFLKRPEEIDKRLAFLADEMFRLSLWNQALNFDTNAILERFYRWIHHWIKDVDSLILGGMKSGTPLPISTKFHPQYEVVFYGIPSSNEFHRMDLRKIFISDEHLAAPTDSTPFLLEAANELIDNGMAVSQPYSIKELAFSWASDIRSSPQGSCIWVSFRNIFFNLDYNSKATTLDEFCGPLNIFQWIEKHSIPSPLFFHLLFIFLEETNP